MRKLGHGAGVNWEAVAVHNVPELGLEHSLNVCQCVDLVGMRLAGAIDEVIAEEGCGGSGDSACWALGCILGKTLSLSSYHYHYHHHHHHH
jgi:hypothetical protein